MARKTDGYSMTIASAFLHRIKDLTVDEIRETSARLNSDLRVGTEWDGAQRSPTHRRDDLIRALDIAPQNYTTSVRILTAVAHAKALIDTDIEERRAGLRASVRAELIKSGIKNPTVSLISDTVRRRAKTEWRRLAEEEADIQAAHAMAEGLVKAWRDRDSSLRKMLDAV